MRKGVLEVVQVRVQWWAIVNTETKFSMENKRILKCAVAPLSVYLHGLRLRMKQCDKVKYMGCSVTSIVCISKTQGIIHLIQERNWQTK
jgi:hypothetical protein